MTTIIKIRSRGALAVSGDFELQDAEGKTIDLGERKKVMLCRCGASKAKPFCDGAHNRVAFDDSDG